MSHTIQQIKTFTVTTCTHSGCGVTFALDDEYVTARRIDHETWYCPNGHPRCWPAKNREEIALERLTLEKESTNFWRDAAQRTGRQLSAVKGQQTKLKNRIAKGVCPCCNRSFVNLEQHMSGQHPEFTTP
jgi:hypothetical protein